MIKAVLFDVDGTLIDTAEANAMAYSHDFKLLGGKPITTEEYRKSYYHLSAKKMFKHFFPEIPDQELDRMLDERKARASRFFKYMKLFPGAKETLEKLHGRFKTGIVTSRRSIHVLDFFGIRDCFDAIVTPDDVKNHKPHPESMNLALQRLGLKPDEAVYVGDAESDLEIGRATGVKVIMYGPDAIKGDFNIRELKEIPKIVEKLNR